jgi:hypothetical protein
MTLNYDIHELAGGLIAAHEALVEARLSQVEVDPKNRGMEEFVAATMDAEEAAARNKARWFADMDAARGREPAE